MSDGMLLGIDEGTTGVKAALFDQRLQPVAEARRDKVNRHPEEGWVEQDGVEVIAAVTGPWPSSSTGPTAGRRLRARPPGQSVLAWDSETGEPLSRSSSGRTSVHRRSSTSSRIARTGQGAQRPAL
jgi:glycerol kinase